MPTKSTQVMPNEILAILILPNSSPTKIDKARYKMVGPTPELVKSCIMISTWLIRNDKDRVYFITLRMMTEILLTNMLTAMAKRMTPKNLRRMKIRFSPNNFWILSSWLMTM